MNDQLIEKVIRSMDSSGCPEFTYENPLIDRKVAGALARSFVKILGVSQQDSTINNNLRHSVLANIRKICRIEPENHLEVDENFTNSLTALYLNKIHDLESDHSTNALDISLDEFLIRRMKEVEINSKHQSSMNPEVVQALVNLNENNSKLISLSKDVLHWKFSDKKTIKLVKDIWTNCNLTESINTSSICDDICVKLKSEIENLLLSLCHCILTDPNIEIETLFNRNITLHDLIKKCSISAECFQICSRILNYLFINTNYNLDIHNFIVKFIKNVKENCPKTISVLYPVHLSPIIVLLDIDLEVLPHKLKSKYVEQTIVHLKTIHEDNETDLILLLSHFPQWFHIYYNKE